MSSGGVAAHKMICCRVMFVVILELLGGHGLAKVEGERAEDVVLGARERVGLGHLVGGERGGHGCARVRAVCF